MSSTPYWALSVIYWLHMLATVAWIGSLASLSLLVLPAARRVLDPQAYASLLNGLQSRLDALGWISLLVLTATGLFQMSANPNYSGFLAIENRWAVAILVKHLVFFGMTGLSAYHTWGLLPALRREALRRTLAGPPGDEPQGMDSLRQREARLLRLNLLLGAIVLGLTALARAA